jgi:hypothetical protein
LNITVIEGHRRIQTLRTLGEEVNGYGRVLINKILRAFLPAIRHRWIVHVKQQGLSEADILKLMEFLGEQADWELTAQKIRRHSIILITSLQRRRFTSTLNSQNHGERKDMPRTLSVCFASQGVFWLKIAR